MGKQVDAFNAYRSKMNEVILEKQNKVINRLYNLDQHTYAEGALSFVFTESAHGISSEYGITM